MAIRAAAQAARQRAGRDRAGALLALDEIFGAGRLPHPPPEGRYRGELLALCLHPWLDALGRAVTAWWLPWQGKTFNRASQTGDNVFSSDGQWLARLVWPLYRGYAADGPGRTRALQFRTYSGPALLRPDHTVLKLDYDWEVNPRFLVRGVLDELAQVDDDYLVGKAWLRRARGQYSCAAYFALTPA